MKLLLSALAAALLLSTGVAQAAEPAAAPANGCESKAVSKDGKPLAGAAKNAFMKKCQKEAAAPAPAASSEAAASCEKKALSKEGKPLAGAAKNAFVKKCVREAGEKK